MSRFQRRLDRLIFADLDGDGAADLVQAVPTGTNLEGEHYRLLPFLGRHDGTFAPLPPLDTDWLAGHYTHFLARACPEIVRGSSRPSSPQRTKICGSVLDA